MQKKFKILIGGGNGYIGTKLSDYLKKKKYNFEVIDLNLYKNCKLYNSNYKHKIKNLDVRDITDDYLKKFDVYIHLAAITNNPVDNFKDKNKLYKITRDYTKGIAKKSGSWNHAMAWIGCDDTREVYTITVTNSENITGFVLFITYPE